MFVFRRRRVEMMWPPVSPFKGERIGRGQGKGGKTLRRE